MFFPFTYNSRCSGEERYNFYWAALTSPAIRVHYFLLSFSPSLLSLSTSIKFILLCFLLYWLTQLKSFTSAVKPMHLNLPSLSPPLLTPYFYQFIHLYLLLKTLLTYFPLLYWTQNSFTSLSDPFIATYSPLLLPYSPLILLSHHSYLLLTQYFTNLLYFT